MVHPVYKYVSMDRRLDIRRDEKEKRREEQRKNVIVMFYTKIVPIKNVLL
jgi:hypothetical protein